MSDRRPTPQPSVDATFAQLLVFVANSFGRDSREAQQVSSARTRTLALLDAAKEVDRQAWSSGTANVTIPAYRHLSHAIDAMKGTP